MPRAVDGTYTLPPGYSATDGEDATASQHNEPLEDIAAALNEATPVSKGGTGSTNATAARTALGLGSLATLNEIPDESVTAEKLADDAVPVLRGHFYGLAPSSGTDADHDIDFTAGECASDDATPVLIQVAALTKRFDATFAEGNAAGGMASGESLPTSGTVHIWAIAKADGTADIFANDHATSGLTPTLPTDFIYKRRIRSLTTDGSANIVGFTAIGAWTYFDAPPQDINTTTSGTTAVLRGLSTPVGVSMLAHLLPGYVWTTAYISSPLLPDVAPGAGSSPTGPNMGSPEGAGHGEVQVWTDLSAQVRTRSASNGNWIQIFTAGYFDKEIG